MPAKSKTTHAEPTAEEEDQFALEKKLARNMKKKENKCANKETEKPAEELASREVEYSLAEK